MNFIVSDFNLLSYSSLHAEIWLFVCNSLLENDVTQDVFDNFAPYWKDRYLTSNVYIKDLNNNETVSIG